MAFDPRAGNPFVTVGTTTAGQSTYAPTTAASAADVTRFTDVENQAARAAGFETPIAGGTPAGIPTGRVLSTYTDPKTGVITQIIEVSDGWGGVTTKRITTQGPAPKSTTINTSDAQSAYDLLYNEFKQYGLESLVEPLKSLIQEGASGATMALALQNTDAYKKRFSANQTRINAGLRALSPAEYLGMEDQYQNLMRQYGLPESYYTKGELGIQEGFNKLLANDISASELEDRLIQAQQKVNNANPEVKQALAQFYPGLTDSDILAYTLDPKNALIDIKRKVAAAEIGGAALAQGLGASRSTAEQLAASGITKAQATQGYGTIAGYLPTATQLSDIYSMQGGGPYTQTTAEAEVFGTAGASEAERLRKKLAKLEQSQFSGQSGTAGSGALSRDRAITNYQLGMSGSGQF